MTSEPDRFKLAFERLDAIMSIQLDKTDNTLSMYRPVFSSEWAATMMQMSAEEHIFHD